MEIYDMTVDMSPDVERFRPAVVPWLPSPKDDRPPLGTADPQEDFTTQLKMKPVHRCIWSVLTASLPKFLAKGYHNVYIADKIDIHPCLSFITPATSFALFSQIYSWEFYHLMQRGIKLMCAVGEAANDRKYAKRRKEALNFQFDLYMMPTAMFASSPKADYYAKDQASNAREFLLEPTVLIQLPWQPVLLQQWLVAALIEVLLFERDSLPLRHWRVHHSVADCAREMMGLVRGLKQRITLGFALLATMARDYPKVDPRHPNYVLDRVVLPSLSTLDYLITGRGHQSLRTIKKVSWCRSPPQALAALPPPEAKGKEGEAATETKGEDGGAKPFDTAASAVAAAADGGTVQLMAWCYTMEPPLEAFFVVNVHSMVTWVLPEEEGCPQPFQTPEDLERLVCAVEAHRDLRGSDLDCQPAQKMMWGSAVLKQARLSIKEKLNLTVKVLKKELVEKGRLPGLTAAMVDQHFSSTKASQAAREVTATPSAKLKKPAPVPDMTHAVILDALQFSAAYRLLRKSREPDQPSVLGQLVTLQLQVREREEVVRMIVICAHIFGLEENLSRALPAYSMVKPLSPEVITKQVCAAQSEALVQNREWLWAQLPRAWSGPVSACEPRIELFEGTETRGQHQLMANLEDRIGRLVYNIAKDCFEVQARGGAPFPAWGVVQYVLPGLAAGVGRECFMYEIFLKRSAEQEAIRRNREIARNYAKLAHEVVCNYEQQYRSWRSAEQPAPRVLLPPVSREQCRDLLHESCFVQQKAWERLRITLLVHLSDDEDFETSHLPASLERCITTVSDYCAVCVSGSWHGDFYGVLRTAYNTGLAFFRTLLTSCERAWGVPGAVVNLPAGCPPELAQLQFAVAVVAKLNLLYLLANDKIKDRDMCDKLTKANNGKWEQIRMDVLRAVAYPSPLVEAAQSTTRLMTMVKEHTKNLLAIYKVLKEYRAKHMIPRFSQCVDFLSRCHPEVRNACVLYMQGKLDQLDKVLTIFQLQPVAKCRMCGRTEWKYGGPLKQCAECVEDNYPDPNFFCCPGCENDWWIEEHGAEHLEFELGLTQFAGPAAQDGQAAPL